MAMRGMNLTDLSQIPLGQPPLGVVPNFHNPESLSWLPKVFIYLTLPLAVLFLGLRFYARIKVTNQKVGVDDYLCLISAFAIITNITLTFLVLDRPAGPHMWNIPRSKVTDQYSWGTTILATMYLIAAMFIKDSLLALYKRIFHPIRLTVTLVWIGIVFTTISYVSLSVALLVGCVPRSAEFPMGGWLSLSLAQRCRSISGPVTIISGFVGTAIDIYILVVPLHALRGLKTSRKRKAGIIGIFLGGSSAVIFSIVGAAYRTKMIRTPGQDHTWNTMPIYAMNVAEINVGIMCGCLPVVFVLFKGNSQGPLVWMTRMWYHMTTSRKITKPSGASDKGQNILYDQNSDVERQELPDIPRGVLTGLRSFIGNNNRTKPMKSQTAMTGDVPLTFVSADYDYHAGVKAEAQSTRR